MKSFHLLQKKGVNEVEFSPKKSGSYGILKDNIILGIIEVVDDLKSLIWKNTRKTSRVNKNISKIKKEKCIINLISSFSFFLSILLYLFQFIFIPN